MEKIKLFETHSEYEAFVQSDKYVEPHVSYCKDDECVQFNLPPAFMRADNSYHTRILSDLYNLGYIEDENLMTLQEAETLNARWLTNQDEFNQVIFNGNEDDLVAVLVSGSSQMEWHTGSYVYWTMQHTINFYQSPMLVIDYIDMDR